MKREKTTYELEHHEFFKECRDKGMTYRQMADSFAERFPEAQKLPGEIDIIQYFKAKDPAERIRLMMERKEKANAKSEMTDGQIAEEWAEATGHILGGVPRRRPQRGRIIRENTKTIKDAPHGYIW